MATLYPGYFALVMATGIVAIGAQQQGLIPVAQSLFAVAGVAYAALVVLLAARIVRAGDRVVADVLDHTRGFAFLTIVAGTNVLASASIMVHGWWEAASALWWWSIGLWVVVLYPTLLAAVIGRDKPGLAAGINGSWFLPTVATQSIAVTAGLLLTRSNDDRLAFVALGAFTLGIILYVIVMTMVFLRWTFHALEPNEIEPPAWIAAGAVAITALAGSNLLLAASTGPARLARVAPFVEGFVVLAWATATFWLPLMVAIGVWRHVVRRVPLRYHPGYWAMVFPLGMYGVATHRMGAAIDFASLAWLPTVVLPVALAAWTFTCIGLVRQLSALAVAASKRRRQQEKSSGER
ncbi:MAG: tellurite resistance/C4-dicarboxylate transporter family protein [Ardenticatenales bacterium]|nr:tellurite resistance/C4-dicarboxylate transporter family protein [Ardenticatenales bacterium]